jgi:hypothetical protein
MSNAPNENGGPRKEAAALDEKPTTKPADVFGDAVNALRLARWLDMALVMHRMGATDPAEFQRLGIWLNRMRKAVQ